MSDTLKRIRQYLNGAIKGKFTSALTEAIAAGDDLNAELLLDVKEQMFVMTAQGTFLEKLMAALGVTKPPGVGISDDLFREIGIKQTNSKLVTNIFLDVLEIFYGEDAIRANVLSGKPEGYVLTDGMTLIVRVDNKPVPLNILFNTADFTNIANASAAEIANVISRQAFNAGYTLTASAFEDVETDLTYVQLLSGTKGPRSSLTILGGSAQNVLRFPEETEAVPNIGTQFTTSFEDQYVRFTWTAGPSPELSFVSPGDYVNIYGQGYLDVNQGTFFVENVQDGPVGLAYFEIINPNFVAQAPVTMTQVPGASGHGFVRSTAVITVAGVARSANVVTVSTSSNHGFAAGQRVTIVNVDNPSFNGEFTIVSTPTAMSFTYNQAGVDASSGGGQASVEYEIAATPTGAVRSGGISTVTLLTNHNFTIGQSVEVFDVNDSSFNGTFPVASVGANTFTYVQDYTNDLVFFNPKKQIIQNQPRYASVYEASPYEITIFLPATTKIVKRELIGSWHLHNSASNTDFLGSYAFNPKEGFPVTRIGTELGEDIFAGELKTVGFGTNTSQFPDEEGFLVFEWGTSNQEGPVRYLGRPSSGSLLLDPAYKFKKTHRAGVDMRLISGRSPYKPAVDGTDYPTYLTGTIQGRIEAINLIKKLKAAGIFLNIVVVYPKGPGLHDVEGYVYAGDFS